MDEGQQRAGRDSSANGFRMTQQQAEAGGGRIAGGGTGYRGSEVRYADDPAFDRFTRDGHLKLDHSGRWGVRDGGHQWASSEGGQLGPGAAAVCDDGYYNAPGHDDEAVGMRGRCGDYGSGASRREEEYLQGQWPPMSQQPASTACKPSAAATAFRTMHGLTAQQAEALKLNHHLPQLKRLRVTAAGAVPADLPHLMAGHAGRPSFPLSPPPLPTSPPAGATMDAVHVHPADYSPSVPVPPARATAAVSDTTGWEEMAVGDTSPVYPVQADSPPCPGSPTSAAAAAAAIYDAGGAAYLYSLHGGPYADRAGAGGGGAGRMGLEERVEEV